MQHAPLCAALGSTCPERLPKEVCEQWARQHVTSSFPHSTAEIAGRLVFVKRAKSEKFATHEAMVVEVAHDYQHWEAEVLIRQRAVGLGQGGIVTAPRAWG